MTLSMLSASPCKPFAAHAAPSRASRVLACRAQVQEPQAARFSLPGAKALTAAAAVALLTVAPAFADPQPLPAFGPSDAVGQRKALGESTANDKAFQTAREDATLDNAFGDSPRPRDRSRQAQPFVPGGEKEARGAQLQETLKQVGPVKGGPDQLD
ncbi:hypothetical protein WJX81_003387 [Elliptochloris bilobata]|uniref:Uncharacterized protein n=1 Tax=Elliptochloris bilobata TaxID=381761 RepID=A0AAW1RRF5_9CHLO